MLLWHMPHGIDLPATPKNNYSCCLLYEQPSLARIHSFTHIHFYCCQRLLGRNNTATTSAPHERCQCRLINSLSIILQKDLMKSSGYHIYIYINIYMYSYSQNYENTTMHYYVHFYFLITYNLLHVFSLHIRWLHIVTYILECNGIKSRCFHTSSVLKDTNQEAIFLTTEGRTP